MIFRSRVTCQFVTGAPKDLNMTLNTTRSNVPHIGVTLIPNFSPLALRPAVFEFQDILRIVHWMPPKDLETYEVKLNPYMCYYWPQSQISVILLNGQ